jgi:outer membrane immunogenic protein
MNSHRLASPLLALLMAATPALAADVGAPATAVPAPDAYTASPAVYDWSGANLGGIAGFGFQDYGTDDAGRIDGDGFFGGAFAGYDFMVTRNVVAGVQADIVTGDNGGSRAGFDADSAYLATLRGRLGYAMDSWLLYGTGGLAVGDLELSDGATSDSQTVFGYAVGAGVETGITDNISARLEYLYVDTATESFDLGAGSTSADLDGHQIRLGLGYRF